MAGPASDGDLARGAALPEPPGLERSQALKGLRTLLAGAVAWTATAAKFGGWAALLFYLAVYGWHVGADWLKTGGLPTLDITELSKTAETDSGDSQVAGAGFAPCPLGGAPAGGLVDTLHGAAFCSLEDLMVAVIPGKWETLEDMAQAKPATGSAKLADADAKEERVKAAKQLADLQAQLSKIDKLIDNPPDLTPEEAGAASAEEAGTRIARYLAKLKGPSSQALESVSSIRQTLAEPAPEAPPAASTPGAQTLITAAANLPLSLLLVIAAVWLERRFAKT